MNIYTFRLTKKHIVAAILALTALIALLILLLPSRENNAEEASAQVRIRDKSDCITFLEGLGYQVNSETAEAREVVIPRSFDAVYESYNEMQKRCGYDLSSFAGKRVELMTFEITNYPGEEAVLADVLVCRKKVIGGAVYTASVDGFMVGLQPLEEISS